MCKQKHSLTVSRHDSSSLLAPSLPTPYSSEGHDNSRKWVSPSRYWILKSKRWNWQWNYPLWERETPCLSLLELDFYEGFGNNGCVFMLEETDKSFLLRLRSKLRVGHCQRYSRSFLSSLEQEKAWHKGREGLDPLGRPNSSSLLSG